MQVEATDHLAGHLEVEVEAKVADHRVNHLDKRGGGGGGIGPPGGGGGDGRPPGGGGEGGRLPGPALRRRRRADDDRFP